MPSSDRTHPVVPDLLPVRLRGHHFLCILTYKGVGYSRPFVANMDAKVSAIAHGAPVELVRGPDDICAGLTVQCLRTVDHDCNAADTLSLDLLAIEAVSNHLGRDLRIAQPLQSKEIVSLRDAFATGAIRSACTGCSWKQFCDEIADSGFKGTRL